MKVVSDLKDLYLPLPDGILVPLEENRPLLEMLVTSIPSLWREQRVSESCLGSALKAAHSVMRPVGGRLLVFASSVPTVGEFTIRPRRDTQKGQTALNVDAEQRLRPAHDDYQSFAHFVVHSQMSVELFLCLPTNAEIDLATIAPIYKNTAGELRLICNFNGQLHGEKLRQEIWHTVCRKMGWEAVMRIRVSRSWKIGSYYGNFQTKNDLLITPTTTEDSTFSAILEMEENVCPDPVVYVQAALLYTSTEGERRIRVHNACFPVAQQIGQIAACIDANALCTLLGLQALDKVLTSKLTDARNYLQGAVHQIVTQIDRQHTDLLRAIPLFILGLLKSIALRDTKDVPPEVRLFHIQRLQNISVDAVTAYMYPRMIPLHELAAHHGTLDGHGQVQLPDPLPLSVASMAANGAYLVENGLEMWLWLGKEIDAHWMGSVFGIPALDALNVNYSESLLGASSDPLGKRVTSIVSGVRESRPMYMNLNVVKQGDPNEYSFFYLLVEDRSQMGVSIDEFLQKLGFRSAIAAIPRPT